MIKYLDVFNLEFPSYCESFSIFDYFFERVTVYHRSAKSLFHTGSVSEYQCLPYNYGTHALTAQVRLPRKRKKAVLAWQNRKLTALSDILLLLSLFTRRHVFVKDWDDGPNTVITNDHREFQWGLTLRTSLRHKSKENNGLGHGYDIGFEKGIECIYKLMRTREWLNRYANGYYLFLFRSACNRQILESSFLLCWTIWEHLFALHNKHWLSDERIRTLPSIEKIAFILVEYGLRTEIEKKGKDRLKRLANVRNRLVHIGQFIDSQAIEDAKMFIEVTEHVIIKSLGIEPIDPLGYHHVLNSFIDKGHPPKDPRSRLRSF